MSDRWGEVTNLVAACTQWVPDLLREVPVADLAPGPARNLVRLQLHRLGQGKAADLAAMLHLPEAELIAGPTLVGELAELPIMQASWPAYLRELHELAVMDQFDRARADGAPLAELRSILDADTAPAEGWAPRSILDGVDLDAPPPRPTLLGLSYPGKLHLISGAPETAKTWLALVIVAEAVRAWGCALILDTDGTGQLDLAKRLSALGLSAEEVARVAYHDDPHELFGTAEATMRVTGWVRERAASGPVVVGIDSANATITALGHKLDEAGVNAFEATVLAPLKRAGAHVHLLDHVAIHAPADAPYSISTQRKHAASDVHLRIKAAGAALMRGGPPATFLLNGPKDRPGGIERRGRLRHVGKVTFTPAPDGAVAAALDLSPPSALEESMIFRPTRLMERVSRWAAAQLGIFSKRDVRRAVEGKDASLLAAVDVLLAEGYLRADGDGYRHARHYREATDPEALNGREPPPPGARGGFPAREGRFGAESGSPVPGDNHAGSRGGSHPPGTAVPSPGGGGGSPGSPSMEGNREPPPGEPRLAFPEMGVEGDRDDDPGYDRQGRYGSGEEPS